jgi:cell wall-associated NlpC family hydrolase
MVRALSPAEPAADIPEVRGLVLALTALVAALFTGACASTGAVPRPFPTPGATPQTGSGGQVSAGAPPEASSPASQPPAGASSFSRPAIDTYALTGTALGLRGVPYRDGGSDPNGFDCSGFTQYVFGQHGLALPREVRDQYSTGHSIKPDEILPGDLIFFSTVAPGASHVGIALGGDTFVHAPSTTGQVRVERISSTYWSPRFLGARRVN